MDRKTHSAQETPTCKPHKGEKPTRLITTTLVNTKCGWSNRKSTLSDLSRTAPSVVPGGRPRTASVVRVVNRCRLCPSLPLCVPGHVYYLYVDTSVMYPGHTEVIRSRPARMALCT